MNNERELNWDDEILEESSFTLLPEGDYDFIVKSFKRGRHPGSAKLPACNKAELEITVDDGNGRRLVITEVQLLQAVHLFSWQLTEAGNRSGILRTEHSIGMIR